MDSKVFSFSTKRFYWIHVVLLCDFIFIFVFQSLFGEVTHQLLHKPSPSFDNLAAVWLCRSSAGWGWCIPKALRWKCIDPPHAQAHAHPVLELLIYFSKCVNNSERKELLFACCLPQAQFSRFFSSLFFIRLLFFLHVKLFCIEIQTIFNVLLKLKQASTTSKNFPWPRQNLNGPHCLEILHFSSLKLILHTFSA